MIAEMLFKTESIKVCPEGKPFWYTSGAIGPYYINTHFLVGGEDEANRLLNIIDETLATTDKQKVPDILTREFLKVYNRKGIYYTVMNYMKDYMDNAVQIRGLKFDAISGGERRDWFFSLMLSVLLDVPHVTFFKDMTATGMKQGLEGCSPVRLFHIADLLNEGSSYIKMWYPLSVSSGAVLENSFVVVDRCQGGSEAVEEYTGIRVESLAKASLDLFKTAFSMGYINEAQLEMIKNYINDPRGSMCDFLVNNPEFIKSALRGDVKTAQRAKLCIESEIYGKLPY